jgi:AbrB family looped-hinge helix DNA binding protein
LVSEVKVSSKYQVVIPKEAREKVGLDKGDTLIVEVENGVITMRRRPESFAEYGRGLHRGVWEGLDVDRYLEELREEWKRQS